MPAFFPQKPWIFSVWIAAGYLLILLVLTLRQRSLLYFPNRLSKAEARRLASGSGFRFWPEEGEEYLGLLDGHAPGQPAATVIVFQGNAGCALDRSFYREQLAGLNIRLILAEYPGYGARSGSPTEEALVSSAKDLVKAVMKTSGGPVFLIGESLGCGVAAAVAGSADDPVNGLILITPWDSLPSLAQKRYWFLPARLLVRERYDNVRSLAGYSGPVAVILAEKDEVIPVQLGRRLYDHLQGRKKLWVLPDAGHNSWPQEMSRELWDEIWGFMRSDHP